MVVQPFQRATADGEGDETLVAELAGAVGGEVELLPPATSLADASSAMGAMGAALTFRFHGLCRGGSRGSRGRHRARGQVAGPGAPTRTAQRARWLRPERLAAQVHEALHPKDRRRRS